MSDHSCRKDVFPNIQSKPPLVQLEAIASHPIASYLGEEINTCLTKPSFQVVVESSKVTPQPPLLQTKQPQLPQSLRLAWDRDRSEVGKHIILISCYHIAGTGLCILGKQELRPLLLPDRPWRSHILDILDADKVVN